MKEMCRIITPYRCKECGQDMVFFLTNNNTLLDYKGLIVDQANSLYDLRRYLESKSIRFMKCLACNKTYIIDWTNEYPVQLTDKSVLNKFGV